MLTYVGCCVSPDVGPLTRRQERTASMRYRSLLLVRVQNDGQLGVVVHRFTNVPLALAVRALHPLEQRYQDKSHTLCLYLIIVPDIYLVQAKADTTEMASVSGQKRASQNHKTRNLTLEDVRSLFVMRQKEACDLLVKIIF